MSGHDVWAMWAHCERCGRFSVSEGRVNRIEAAWDRDGRAPLIDTLTSWVQTPRRSRLRRAADVAVALDALADGPLSLRRTELNALGDDMWELKVGTLRIPFGVATCPGPNSRGEVRCAVLPSFVPEPASNARCIRLTHAFRKATQRTPRRELDRARAILREDRVR
jgi:phage-related protein